MQWADATVWSAVRRLPSGDPELRDRFHHLHATQWACLKLWRSEPVSFAPAEELQQWVQSYYRELADFLPTVGEDSLDREVKMPWADRYAKRTAAPTTLWETMLQITSHSSHHRGQVVTRIRALGADPPLVDYIAWLWLGRPAPDWT